MNDLRKKMITNSGNFYLTKKIKTLDAFWDSIKANPSIFARHRMYPSSFFYSWNIKLIKKWLDNGWFWEAKKFKNLKKQKNE